MSWASRRRFFIIFIFVAIGLVILAALSFVTFYKTPSCSDNVQNQGEQGIDCGGPCPYLCTAKEDVPLVLFTKVIPKGNGTTDVVASIENRNATAAAKAVPYTLTLYDANQKVVQEKSGTVDLPPATNMPLYVAGIQTGKRQVTSAFLTIASSSPHWFTMMHDTRSLPVVSNVNLNGSTSTPRIEATVSNSTNVPMFGVSFVVLVHGDQNNVIAASKTVVPNIPAQGQSTAVFTWNVPFPSAPTNIEVIPTLPLP